MRHARMGSCRSREILSPAKQASAKLTVSHQSKTSSQVWPGPRRLLPGLAANAAWTLVPEGYSSTILNSAPAALGHDEADQFVLDLDHVLQRYELSRQLLQYRDQLSLELTDFAPEQRSGYRRRRCFVLGQNMGEPPAVDRARDGRSSKCEPRALDLMWTGSAR